MPEVGHSVPTQTYKKRHLTVRMFIGSAFLELILFWHILMFWYILMRFKTFFHSLLKISELLVIGPQPLCNETGRFWKFKKGLKKVLNLLVKLVFVSSENFTFVGSLKTIYPTLLISVAILTWNREAHGALQLMSIPDGSTAMCPCVVSAISYM